MRDYELITMDVIIQPVYRIFKEYPLNPNMDACPCCVTEEDKKTGISKNLQQLTAEELNHYSCSELTKDGSQMKDWGKYTTRDAVTLPNGQKVQVHFYKNDVTGEVNTNIDYKITPEVMPARVYSRKQ
ncbi:MAG TPA: hypothetical protein VNK03_05590 [Gammaproteobacteria bacterium]|nr:hypothetical protein [Gammaproteobacteria bacterium]